MVARAVAAAVKLRAVANADALHGRVGAGEGDDDAEDGDEGKAVEGAVDGDGAERGRFAHCLALTDEVGADELADTRRRDVIGHEADEHDGVETQGRDFTDGAQEEAPTHGPEPEADEVEWDGDEGEGVVAPSNAS